MLFVRKTNMFTFSGLRKDLVGVTIIPAMLSDAQLVAHMERYYLANFASRESLP